MDNVANLPQKKRKELFQETAAKMGVHPAIAEKDFWVCWVLMKLFADQELASCLVFKGGTSLSKAYDLIDRFSEDIDLILDWQLLGYGPGGIDPWVKQPSNTQLDLFNQQFNSKAAEYIRDSLQPKLELVLSSCTSIRSGISKVDPQTIEIEYPATHELTAIRPYVKLEIGPLASWMPSHPAQITSYAAKYFPDVFDSVTFNVATLKAERTFWEKATILHQQAHRETPMPSGYSRHYYDLFRLSGSDVKKSTIGDISLLAEVVKFKSRFYRCAWARYDLALPGTFKLMPNEAVVEELEKDYARMRPMFFSTPPSWGSIMDELSVLEAEINSQH